MTSLALTDLENELMVTRGKWWLVEVGGIDCEFAIDKYMLLYVKQTPDRDLLCSRGDSARQSRRAQMGEEFEKK